MTQKSVCEIELNETQYDALAALNDAACDVAFLIGGIGSGKTFLLAAALEKYANENQITFINLNPIFAPQKVLKKEFTSDDLHLNGSAYKLWANEIKKYF